MFKEDVERTIGKVLKDKKHKVVHIAMNCTYYMKRYSDKLAFYIRCSDNRNHNGGISVQMFFTAIQMPDDRLTAFDVGLNIHIITVYSDITDEMMIAAGEKIVALEDNIGNLADTILEEIKKPYFPNKRLEKFNEILLVYDTINEDITLQDKFDSLRSQVWKATKRKKKMEIFQLCSEFVDSLSADYFKNKGINFEINRIKNILAEQFHAQCILDI